MELATPQRKSGFRWEPVPEEKKKKSGFNWTPVPEVLNLETKTYAEKLKEAKGNPASLSELYRETVKRFDENSGRPLSKGETYSPSHEELTEYIKAKHALNRDWGKLPHAAWDAVKMVGDEIVLGTLVGGPQEGFESMFSEAHKDYFNAKTNESKLNRAGHQTIGSIAGGTEGRRQVRLPKGTRETQDGKLKGGTLYDLSREYLRKEHQAKAGAAALFHNMKNVQSSFDKLPGVLKGAASKKLAEREDFGEKALQASWESIERVTLQEFRKALPESNRKTLDRVDINSMEDLYDVPEKISLKARAGMGVSAAWNIPKSMLATATEAVAQAGHGTAMMGHMAWYGLRGGPEKLDTQIDQHLLNQSHTYRVLNGMPDFKRTKDRKENVKNALEGIPEDVVAGWNEEVSAHHEKKMDELRYQWVVINQYQAEMERVRLGKEPLVSEALRLKGFEGAAKVWEESVNRNMALGGGYIADAPVAVPVHAIRKGLVKETIKRPAMSALTEKIGKGLTKVDEKVLKPITLAPEWAAGKISDLTGTTASKLPGAKTVGAGVDIVFSFPEIGSGAIRSVGETAQAIGRATKHGRTLQSTTSKVFNDPKAPVWLRKIASKLDPADRFLAYGYGVTADAAKGAGIGAGLTAPTGDPEVIGAGMGSGTAAGTIFSASGRLFLPADNVKMQNALREWKAV